MSYFTVKNIVAGYGKQNVIENVSFQLEKGSLMGVLGANGNGKTTLLKSMCGIIPHLGTCDLNGDILEKLSSRQIASSVSYIPQRSGISIDISVLDVVLMGFNAKMGLLERPGTAMKKAALQAISYVGLSGKENTNYLHLSEGQKQLCIIARTLVSDAQLLLLDEPESALDFNFRYKMISLLKSWISSGERCAVVTLHDPSLALNYCDSLLLLADGKVLDIIYPQSDTLEKMQEKLSVIYGKVSLQRCYDRKGQSHIVMLREEKI